ncbi:myb/SANT-like DNA-binding domain-containing protein 4 [Xenopus laevis]|uniref:Myb/SANT-like DNA-binding domain-containing protein 4 n=1 Tax=Xenopus laevis TaxID=8355 RepID=A0A8J1KP60_XENLA|nr:myb/SANT-like DNA-binding domain-containing protein 4 [Xenopus laevis]
MAMAEEQVSMTESEWKQLLLLLPVLRANAHAVVPNDQPVQSNLNMESVELDKNVVPSCSKGTHEAFKKVKSKSCSKVLSENETSDNDEQCEMDDCFPKQKNRKRMAKFTNNELEVLIREITENYELLYGSISGKISTQRKNQIWEGIKNKVCAVGVGQRTVVHLKKRWLDIRRRTKDKLSVLEKSRRKTGGGDGESKQLSQFESQVQETIPDILVKGDSILDSSDPKSVATYAVVDNFLPHKDTIEICESEEEINRSNTALPIKEVSKDTKAAMGKKMFEMCLETSKIQEKIGEKQEEMLTLMREQTKAILDQNCILKNFSESVCRIESAFFDFLKMERHLVLAVENEEGSISSLADDSIDLQKDPFLCPVIPETNVQSSNVVTNENMTTTKLSVDNVPDVDVLFLDKNKPLRRSLRQVKGNKELLDCSSRKNKKNKK